MPSSIVPFLIDFAEVKAAFGCKDKDLFARIQKKARLDSDDTDVDDFEEADEEDEDIDLDEIEELPSSRDALQHIIMGTPWARGIGSKYGYAFEAICKHFGNVLDREFWGETRGEYVAEFDKILSKVGVDPAMVSMSKLINDSEEFELPTRADFPFIGSMTPAECRDASAMLDKVDRAVLEKACGKLKTKRGNVEPAFVLGCFDELVGWCKTATSAGKGLVVFYY